jgi:hypothetical protein
MPVIEEMLVRVKSVPAVVDKVEHVMASSPVMVKVIVPEVDVADVAAKVAVGAVVSAPAGMVTVTDCGEPMSVVCISPVVSAREKVPDAVSVDTLAPPPAVAEEIAVIVHSFADV